MGLIAFEDVACTRGGRLLFDGMSFALAPGDALVVSGPNGVGKSSMIRIAAGLLLPQAGRVTGDAKRALLAEAHALDPELPLTEAVAFWARIDGVAQAGGAVAAALEAVSLGHAARVPVRMLSTGQRRRAALAPLIAADAPIWLLDEPANGLDTASVAQLEGIIAAHRALGGAVITATHLPLALPGAQVMALAGMADA
ncbi:MAG: heme ABC exporter ATP-binding protein CcmA [Sphingomonas sp.]